MNNQEIKKYSVINDAIHSVMSFPDKYKDLIKDIIDSPTFQRLRHIKQLGMCELIFPTAVHNRFSHCVGAAYIAYQISEKMGLDEHETKYAIIAALLHDIGHGPFSHAFENLLKADGEKKIKHEKWTEHFIKGFEKNLSKEGIDYKVIISLIEKEYLKSNGDNKYNIAADIVSSQLDADKLDYLLRDSHFCGVPYGNPDISWIINHMTKINETGQAPRLGIYKKGWRAVEHVLLCRRIMNQNVYQHHKKNVLEELLINFLVQICNELTKGTKELEGLIYNKSLKNFLKNVAEYRSGKIGMDSFIKDNFTYYKELTDYDIWMLIRDISADKAIESMQVSKIAQRIYKRRIHKCYSFPETSIGAIISIIDTMKKNMNLFDWEIFTVQNKILSYESEDDPILVIDETEKVFRIQEYSFLLSILGDKQEKEAHLAIDIDLLEKHKDFIKSKFSKYINSIK